MSASRGASPVRSRGAPPAGRTGQGRNGIQAPWMAAFIVSALCALILLKPQEFVPALAGAPLVHIAFGAALLAIALDILRRRIRPAITPLVLFVAAFFAWAWLTTVVKQPGALADEAISFAILAGMFAAVAVGFASRRGLWVFAGMFAGSALLVTIVAVVQSQRPFGCFLGAADDWEGKGELTFDGRPCESTLDCRKDAPVPDGNYRCEHIGPLATSSVGGRVRYRGSLADPNELSLMIAASIPFVLGLGEGLKRARARPVGGRLCPLPPLLSDALLARAARALQAIPAIAAALLMGIAVILARSRSGLFAFLFVVGASLIRKVGAFGVVIGCFVAPPMLLFGGRGGAEAEESSDERAGLLREGFELIRETRGVGIGAHQFADASSIGLTAHNAYVLAAAEAGIVGLFLFGFVLYLALKVPYAIWFGRYQLHPTTARFAPALAIALSGAALGIVFLSWTYKDILYMLIGASAALHAAARAEDPRVKISLSLRETIVVGAGIVALMGVVYLGARLHR